MLADLHRLLERRRFTILLLALVSVQLLPVIRGFTEDDASGLMWGVALLAAVNAASGRRRVTWIFAVIGVISFGGRLATVFGLAGRFQNPVDAGAHIVAAVFTAMIIWVVFRAVATSPQVNGDTVMGAVSVYVMIGLLWTNFYALVYLAEPGSFRFPDYVSHAGNAVIPEFTFGYYSFVTLTTLGYGDVAPLTFRARTLSWMEAVVGVTYMATVIAFLVSQLMVEHRADWD